MNPVVIFVRPQAQGNVGALARVMSNFFCFDLRLVKGVAGSDTYGKDETPFDWGMACKGKNILETLKIYPTLGEAASDVDFVLGTTARPRETDNGYSREYLEISEAYQTIKNKISEEQVQKWALVIGAESDGLSDQEISFCHKVAYIKTSDENPSMNAAMAAGAMLFFWQQYVSSNFNLQKEEADKSLRRGRSDWASLGDRESFLEYLMDTLAHTSFFKYPDREASKARFRRWIQNAQVQQGELLFAFEALYHLRAKMTGKFEKRDFLNTKKEETT